MIEEKFVDLYAHNSGVRDKLVAERDVVLTYALRALHDGGLLKDLAFKGGTALRKMVFGSTGRFSEDLDFTLASTRKPDDVFIDVLSTFTKTYHGITFELDEDYQTIDERSFGADVTYRHPWNESGRFHLQISLREEPTLPVTSLPMKEQS